MTSTLRLLFCFIFSSPFYLVCQVGTNVVAADIIAPGDTKGEELYSADGVYKLLYNGKTKVLGHHNNKIKTGEFIYYDDYGQIEKKEHYQDGILHGDYIEYTYATPKTKREYDQGKKINYEYAFKYKDTLFMAGPYLKDEFSKALFTIRSKETISMSDGVANMQINYDTIFFEALKPVRVHHYSFIRTAGIMSRTFFATLELKTKKASYSPAFLESVVSTMKSYVPYYVPSRQNCLTRYYDKSGKLVFQSDSAYAMNYYANGKVKDSLGTCDENKICRKSYDVNGKLMYALRMDKRSPYQTTNLYYDKNKKLIYEINFFGEQAKTLKIYSDSVKNKNAKGELIDCFENHYYYNPATFIIDSTIARLQFRYRYKEKIPDGRYFFIAPKGKKKRMYRFLEIQGNRMNDETVDSTLVIAKSNGWRVDMFRRDSIIYFVSDNSYYPSNPKEEKYIIRKFLFKDGKFYIVHSLVRKTNVTDKQTLLLAFEADTLPNLKTELIPEQHIMEALNLKPIYKMPKNEYMQWIKRCENLKALDEKNKALFIGNNEYYYSVDLLRRVNYYELYRMGYNPYMKEDDYVFWLHSLKLTPKEYEYALKFLQ